MNHIINQDKNTLKVVKIIRKQVVLYIDKIELSIEYKY